MAKTTKDSRRAPVKYSHLVEETAVWTGHRPDEVKEIADVFLDKLISALAEGGKIRLGDFGSMRAQVSDVDSDRISIKFTRTPAPQAEEKASFWKRRRAGRG